MVYVRANRYVVLVSREERCKQAVDERGRRNIGVENRAGWSVCREACLVQKSTPFVAAEAAGIGEAPGGRYVGQQHASLAVPMGRFAKSSSGTIRLRNIAGVWQTSYRIHRMPR